MFIDQFSSLIHFWKSQYLYLTKLIQFFYILKSMLFCISNFRFEVRKQFLKNFWFYLLNFCDFSSDFSFQLRSIISLPVILVYFLFDNAEEIFDWADLGAQGGFHASESL